MTTLRLDLHVHTSRSDDAEAPVDEVLARAADAGLDGLAVTDHDAVASGLRAAERASEYGLLVVPGVEVSTADGHLLALGVDARPDPGCSLATTVERVRALGGIAVVPHPFQRSRHGAPREAIEDCDGIEVYNAHYLTGFRNGQAAAFAAERGHPTVGGSDAHRPASVGRGYTEVVLPTDDPDVEEVLAAVRDGRTRARGHRTPVRRYVRRWTYNARLRARSPL